jgi:hypothetical protein
MVRKHRLLFVCVWVFLLGGGGGGKIFCLKKKNKKIINFLNILIFFKYKLLKNKKIK